jgi:hypothetical protein
MDVSRAHYYRYLPAQTQSEGRYGQKWKSMFPEGQKCPRGPAWRDILVPMGTYYSTIAPYVPDDCVGGEITL